MPLLIFSGANNSNQAETIHDLAEYIYNNSSHIWFHQNSFYVVDPKIPPSIFEENLHNIVKGIRNNKPTKEGYRVTVFVCEAPKELKIIGNMNDDYLPSWKSGIEHLP
ncbi:hypothetical protein [Acetobacter fabarum]|uniref:hypothetical protein n=1 Tax=Acetobacter fabarum TaxID=483199 RepID=UPI0011789E71|nr:hypothetical protein [Acetobacter fabarum]